MERAASRSTRTPHGADLTHQWRRVASGERLTASLERWLAVRAQGGDATARDRMIRANVPLVLSIARQYDGARLELDDLIQEGMIGLCTAVDRFDAKRGFRFSTYASFWIRQRVLRALDQQDRLIRLPVDVANAARKIQTERDRLTQENGQEPSLDELAAACGISARRLEAVMGCLQDPLSLDAPVHEDEDAPALSVADRTAPSPEDVLITGIEQTAVMRQLRSLPPRDRKVLEARFGITGDGATLGEVAEGLGVSVERVRQIQRRALERLRKQFLAEQYVA